MAYSFGDCCFGSNNKVALKHCISKGQKTVFSLTVASSNCIFRAQVLGFRVSTKINNQKNHSFMFHLVTHIFDL